MEGKNWSDLRSKNANKKINGTKFLLDVKKLLWKNNVKKTNTKT